MEDLKAQLAGKKEPAKKLSAQDRKTRRMTKAARQTQLVNFNVMDSLDSVLGQIGGLDRRLR